MVNVKALSTLTLTVGSVVPALAAAVNSQALNHAPDTTRCYTSLCDKSTKVKTSWSTEWIPCTKTVTSTSKTTKTPAAITSTSTFLTTTTSTAPASYQTQTTIITITDTDSTTTTRTATETSSIVLSTTATTTIPTSDGFVPIRTSLPLATCDDDCGTNPVQKRTNEDVNETLERRVSSNLANNPFKGGAAKAHRYPKSVTCIKWSPSPNCSTKTKTITQTKTAPTPTSTAITSSTTTVTFVPSATTTVSDTTTVTSISTATASTTSTSTSTTTSTLSVVSVYAACATNNIADLVDGQGVIGYNPGSGVETQTLTALTNSAYDCCVASNLITQGFSQFYAFELSSNTCTIAYGDSCPSGSASQTFTVITGEVTFAGGNGNCGEFVP